MGSVDGVHGQRGLRIVELSTAWPYTSYMMKTIAEQIESKKSEIFYTKGVLNNMEGTRSCQLARGERDLYKYTGMLMEHFVKRVKELEYEIERMENSSPTWCFDNRELSLV